jgi:hypothetical protein
MGKILTIFLVIKLMVSENSFKSLYFSFIKKLMKQNFYKTTFHKLAFLSK